MCLRNDWISLWRPSVGLRPGAPALLRTPGFTPGVYTLTVAEKECGVCVCVGEGKGAVFKEKIKRESEGKESTFPWPSFQIELRRT